MIGTDLTNARGAVRVCCALGCNVNKHVHGRSDICCMRRNPSHQRRNVNNATQLPVQIM